MKWEFEGELFEDCVVIHRVGAEFGALSNMSNGFPVEVFVEGDEGLEFKSSEAVYQACRFPHCPAWQEEIRRAPHAMRAKMVAKKGGRRAESRPDWDSVRVEVMRWCLAEKLFQHFGPIFWLLKRSGERPIVELSRHDRFWGSVLEEDGVMRGQNWLGRLWMEVRRRVVRWMDDAEDDAVWPDPARPQIDGFAMEGRLVA